MAESVVLLALSTIFCRESAVARVAVNPSVKILLLRSEAITMLLVASWISTMRPRLSSVASTTVSASRRISWATTPNRRPVSPAPAASRAALKAISFVRSAISSMTSITSLICCTLAERATIPWVLVSWVSLIASMAVRVARAASMPPRASSWL